MKCLPFAGIFENLTKLSRRYLHCHHFMDKETVSGRAGCDLRAFDFNDRTTKLPLPAEEEAMAAASTRALLPLSSHLMSLIPPIISQTLSSI